MNAYVTNELARIRQGELLAEAERGRLARIARDHSRANRQPRFSPTAKILAAAASAAALLTAASAVLPH